MEKYSDEINEILEESDNEKLFREYAKNNFYNPTAEDIEGMIEAYGGSYESKEHWAEEYLDDSGQLDQIPSNLRYYFDYQSFARDCELGGDVDFFRDSDGELHVFYAW